MELEAIFESDDALQFEQKGVRMIPTPSANVPNETVFLNSDGVSDLLCYKDGNGVVRRLRMQAV